MEFGTVLLTAVAVVALGLSTVALWRVGRSRAQRSEELEDLNRVALQLATSQSSLAGRLDQMAAGQSAAQAHVAEALQAQERALGKTLEDRLTVLGQRVGEGLRHTVEHTAQTMADLRERIARIDAAQKEMAALSDQVTQLQDILANKQARGAFGEIQLENLVQAALPPDAYEFQAQIGDGRRVDCLLRLPNPPGPIAIDAKFPLEAYRQVLAATDDVQRDRARKALASDVLNHVRDIRRRYIVPGATAESALMFLPSEAVYAELHANLTEVVQQSYRERVWIVSPTTLMATLNTVRAVMRDARMREQAHLIQAEVRTLLTDVGRLDDRVERLQAHFAHASDDIKSIRTSTDKIVKRAGRIEEVELGNAEEPAALAAGSPPVSDVSKRLTGSG